MYAKCLSLEPHNVVFYVLQATTLDSIGHVTDSLRCFATARRMNPDQRIATWERIYSTATRAKAASLLYPAPSSKSPSVPAVQAACIPASHPKRDRGAAFAAAKHVAHAIHGYRLTLGGKRLNRVGYDGKGTLGWTTSGIVYDSDSGSGVSLVAQGQEAAGRGRGCVETGTLEQLLGGMDKRRQQHDEDRDSQRAQAMIRANQQPVGANQNADKWCGKRRLLILQLGRSDGKTGRVDQELHGFGLGAAMHVLSVALSYGVRYNRTVLLPDHDSWWYTDPAQCKHRSFMCFFEPVSPCSTDRHVGSESMQDLNEDSERPRRGARARVVVAPTRLDKFLNHEDNRLWVPPEFAQRGALWWRSQLVKYFFKPNAVTRHALEAKALALGLDGSWGSEDRASVIGVHVRHGDKKTESAIIPIEQYLEAAKSILLCSDDGNNVRAAQRWAKTHEVRLLVDTKETRGVSSATDLANAYHKINTTAFALDAIASLWNLGMCRAFVGTFS